MNNRVLVVATHPDDETLGCGGTLLRHRADGDSIFWLIATEMRQSRMWGANKIAARRKEISQVSARYGFEKCIKLGLPTTRVDQFPVSRIVDKISSVISGVKPDTIYLPFSGDVHSDHRRIFDAAFSCTKVFRYPFIRNIHMMETLSETEFSPSTAASAFVPNCFVDVTPFMDSKLEILKIYRSEIGAPPFPRSADIVRSLATVRGSTAGCAFAEAFVTLKTIR